MEADVLWKAAMRPRLPTGLGKRPPTATRVSHSSHSPYHYKKRPDQRDQTPAASAIKCYLCSRSKLLPMFQVAQPKADEGALPTNQYGHTGGPQ
jgi:hypothetical protein